MPTDLPIYVLLVEDDIINSQLFKMMLERLGYQADLVLNGQEALDKLSENTYKIVLMDCQMPILDGYAATQALREREAPGQHTIVIGLSAHAMADMRARCLASGMDDYLPKPLRINDLATMLQKWI
jgi:two-component system CheB/CheR fusion protein